MSKRMIIAVLCILTALFVSIGSVVYISSQTKKIVAYLDNAQQLYDKGEDISAEVGKSSEVWKKVKRKFGIMIKHVDADELERNFIIIDDILDKGNEKELFEAVCNCKAALEVMLDGELPKSENIF